MVSMFQLFLLPFLAPVLHVTGVHYHLITSPQPSVLEIGTNFTATCSIVDTTEVTADDLYWNLTKTTVPRAQYTKVNSSALNVTIAIREDTPNYLFCFCKKRSEYVRLNEHRFQHGIFLKTGYPPDKPENLSCVAVQEKSQISTLTCEWETRGRSTTLVPTSQKLFVKYIGAVFNATPSANKAQVRFSAFPHFMSLEIWVEADNELGRVESERLWGDGNSFVQTSPPSNVQAISEKNFSTSLLINWTEPMPKVYLSLKYEIRFCRRGASDWTYVPLGDVSHDVQSFRLQKLEPDTVYMSQVRCKYFKEDQGYWSEWSANATQRTPEDRPSGKPDLWRIITDHGRNGREVEIVCKDPRPANGRITRFNVRIQDERAQSGSEGGEWESVAVNGSEGDRPEAVVLKTISLPENKFVKVHATADNSVGTSLKALMGIPKKTNELDLVQGLRVWRQEGKLQVAWKLPHNRTVTEYVVEWTDGDRRDWQRESRLTTTHTAIRGSLEVGVCYRVSVYPIYSGWVGKAAHAEAFLEENEPSGAPDPKVQGNAGHTKATLEWEISDSKQKCFTNYTLFYKSGKKVLSVPLQANATSYTLNSLSPDTHYTAWIQASSGRGLKNGSSTNFITQKYAPGEIEGIVVGVSLGVIFVFLLSMLLCIYKRDVIKDNFWPEIPNPGESTIGTWSPDYSLKAETPKESCLSGISVLDMDMCDAKCVFEEDKASLALKKDKYLSEEHSSGIGGSSCMSSPRQSVSDSDEGGDVADTTASTVQYSSVVASSGYKGQTPGPQAQPAVFSRSESTQPLLDSEENPDVAPECGRAARRLAGPPAMELQDVVEPLDFCPLEEDAEAAPPAAPASSYMPQLGGYRPQCQ
ncbi:interleukin-6 receptor subunit beta [Salarias fasciatus]|uniref:Fibronectin type-III domain-containing protein n=1 Tax=Salarias fasciatus TaxID=181472 RepID=A0A672F9P2_SALFA|nr:interleukin-6 receptor subunit beta [Salarias fasciatus]